MNSRRKEAWQGSRVCVLKNSNIISNQEGNYHRLNLVGRGIIFIWGIVFLLWALCGGVSVVAGAQFPILLISI